MKLIDEIAKIKINCDYHKMFTALCDICYAKRDMKEKVLKALERDKNETKD